ncbi:unnamed protein product [Effrenium voratum]|nr:unnamed protein product [Effrenium voratum]
MRFGKLLAARTQNSRANEPYISYKELKHNLSKVYEICGKDDDNSSDDGEPEPCLQEAPPPEALAASSSSNPRIVGPQEDFFSLIDRDVVAAKLYVRSSVSGLEAMLGEFQVAAIKAGLLFTPQQLEEVSSRLPLPAPMDQEALVAWLLALVPSAKIRDARRALVQKCARLFAGRRMDMAHEEEEFGDTSEEEGEGPAAGYSTLAVEGAKESAGSVGHPDGCTPCTFYCFTRRGCNRGAGCKFCHMTHQSKLQQRREAWKKQQREKRKLMRGFAHKEEVMAEAPLPRPVSRNKKPLEEQAFKGGGSSVKSVVFT